MQAIDKDKYEVVPIGITKEGRWIVGNDPMQTLTTQQAVDAQRTMRLPMHPQPRLLPGSPETDQIVLETQSGDSESGPGSDLDVIFPVLHGPFGEDGTVQGFLDLLDIPYVGAGVTASALAMDKVAAKDLFKVHGLPTLPYLAFLRRDWEQHAQSVIAACEDQLSYPMFVKPANLGSSVGISKAHDRPELVTGLKEAARFDRKLLVEQGIEGREIEISVLGNDDPIASVPGEIIPCREFYSYAAKYLDDASDLLIPAPISEEETELVRQLAIRAYTAVDCAGMARVDFLMDKASGDIWLNEMNTIPGFTSISMYPKLWAASGISYPELIDRLLQLGFERHADRKHSDTAFDVLAAT
jgi:D-alanine-D-alanine ligase